MSTTLLELKDIYKSFGPTKAVQGVSMVVQAGEVRGLIGENGSGKSTLMAMVTGSLHPDHGSITYLGNHYTSKSVVDASNQGISILIQELGTIKGLTVAENIFLGKENLFSGFLSLAISKKKMIAEARKILDKVNAGYIQPTQLIDKLSFEDRKLVEVCRALYTEPNILIIDETTTALSHKGRDIIYNIIKEMKKQNKTVIFISHNLEEVRDICDSVTVLRDGQYISTIYGDEVTPDEMRKLMIGRDFTDGYYRTKGKSYVQDEVVLQVKDICYPGFLNNVSFELKKGEILGLGGLTECGMHELCKIVFGAISPSSGEVIITKANASIKSPTQAISNSIAYLPKDRDQESLFILSSIQENITVSSLDQIKKSIYLSPKLLKALAEKSAEALSIKMQNVNQLVKELSGGNKQKVAFSKWLSNESEIFILDCPTRGIDIGVKAAIYHLMEELIKDGKSIIMVSEEMPELIGMSDRIIILKDGHIAGEFYAKDNLTESILIEKII